MTRKYFGTDGIRGRVGDSPITPDFVLKLGHAVGRILVQNYKGSGHPGVLIGKDTRVSGYMLESALEAGLISAGVEVYLAGPIPTPAVAYLTRTLRLQAGVVISASHNPYHDNGIKFFSELGQKLPDELERAIEAAIDEPMVCVPAEKLGKAHRLEDAQGRYIEFCKSTFPAELNLRGMRIVVDCAHGAGYLIAPKVLHELGADVITIGAAPDGFNINEGVGATHTKALEKAVVDHWADLGVALDGDADRLIMVDSSGAVLDGDQLLYVLARDWNSRKPLPGVVGTLMSNLALEKALKNEGIGFARAKVGDRYVMEELLRRGWQVGGESSGHIISLDKHTTGDGVIAALAVLAAVKRSGRALTELTGELTLYPQKLINVPVVKGFDWAGQPAIQAAIAKAENALGGAGRILIRASGTEPLLRVMAEGGDGALVQEMAEMVAATVRNSVA